MQRFRIGLLVIVVLLLGSLSARAGLICSETRYTPVRVGTGETCAAAEGAANGSAWTDVYLDCYYWNFNFGHCYADFIVSEECTGHLGCYSVGGYYEYSCLQCDPDNPCE